MILSANNLKYISTKHVIVPDKKLLTLPEKVLQFGTGVLLRGLPNYFIDKANRAGIFNGRIVVVKSTDLGDTSAFDLQDNLYTICIRGVENGETVKENIICSAISRVLSASAQWNEIMVFAKSADLKIVLSNTTEVGIKLVEEGIFTSPPSSYPGKLTAILYERFEAFDGDPESGLTIIPTELLPNNGAELKRIILALAAFNKLPDAFTTWLNNHNNFCNSLVDRIVPGKPDESMATELSYETGYDDALSTVSEVYCLWAIEGNDQIANILAFAQADEGVVITPDIEKYREIKLRLLNGTHTLTCGLAFLAGYETVKAAMNSEEISSFIIQVMKEEIAPSIPYAVPLDEAKAFSDKVIDRFKNPHLEHFWLAITMQYTLKMKMRVLPLLLNFYKIYNTVPDKIAFGFAAYLYFMKPYKQEDGKYYGLNNNKEYLITDPNAEYFFYKWKELSQSDVIHEALSDLDIWGQDLTLLPGFEQAVAEKLQNIANMGVLKSLNQLNSYTV